jgi:hypothetical protein
VLKNPDTSRALNRLIPQPNNNLCGVAVDISHSSHLVAFLIVILLIDAYSVYPDKPIPVVLFMIPIAERCQGSDEVVCDLQAFTVDEDRA